MTALAITAPRWPSVWAPHNSRMSTIIASKNLRRTPPQTLPIPPLRSISNHPHHRNVTQRLISSFHIFCWVWIVVCPCQCLLVVRPLPATITSVPLTIAHASSNMPCPLKHPSTLGGDPILNSQLLCVFSQSIHGSISSSSSSDAMSTSRLSEEFDATLVGV